MILIKSATVLAGHLQKARNKQQTIGFVPTMGALHRGHLSLLDAARKENTVIICSIFVNPTQFNDNRDFEKYPVTLEKDIELLEESGVDFLFLPSVTEVYPSGTTNLPQFPLGYLETILEGKYRPGHFQGVCQVMKRLLDIVQPNDLYMGQKDYQQCMVIKKLMQISGMHTVLHTCPTLRESGGLAMSSRNMRLDPIAREKAALISTVLKRVTESVKPGPLETITQAAEQALAENGFKVDYVEITAADTLEILDEWDGKRHLVTLAAAYMGEIRLIDNMLIPVTNSY